MNLEILGSSRQSSEVLVISSCRFSSKEKDVLGNVSTENLGSGLIVELADKWKRFRVDKGIDVFSAILTRVVDSAIVKALEKRDFTSFDLELGGGGVIENSKSNVIVGIGGSHELVGFSKIE